MRSLDAIGQALRGAVDGAAPLDPASLLTLGEEVLEHWVTARGEEPTDAEREGFRLLALHRQGANGNPSFNACRETCRELVYHYNLLTLDREPAPERPGETERLRMMALVANHLFLFVSGKIETRQLGEFCCSSKPLHAVQ